MQRLHKILTITLLTLSSSIYAWTNEVSAGFGYGREFNRAYNNYGFLVSGGLSNVPIYSHLSILSDSSAAYWHANTSSNKHIFAWSMSGALRGYFIASKHAAYRPFVQAALGPTYLTKKTLGTKNQGEKFTFQTRLGGGIEIGDYNESIVVLLQYLRYDNFGMKKPNQSINIPFVVSIGYET